MSNLIYRTTFSVDLHEEKDVGQINSYLRKFNSLPENIQEVMKDRDASEKTELRLIEEHGLGRNQILEAFRIGRDVLLCDVFIGDIVNHISNRLGIDMASAKNVTAEIVGGLFAPAIDDIKKMQREKFAHRLSGGAARQRDESPKINPISGVNEENVVNLRE